MIQNISMYKNILMFLPLITTIFMQITETKTFSCKDSLGICTCKYRCIYGAPLFESVVQLMLWFIWEEELRGNIFHVKF